MTTLHDRLSDLADDVEAAPGPATPDLWRDGRRLARRRRVTAVVAVAAGALLVALGTGATAMRAQGDRVAPADGRGAPAVPDEIYAGSSWLPRGSQHGLGGPLAAVYEEQRTTWSGGSTADLLAVSAVDQSYRWLDLPDYDKRPTTYAGQQFSLSPDGSYLAYWTVGVSLTLTIVDTVTGQTRNTLFDADLAASTIGWIGDVVRVCPGEPCREWRPVDARTGELLDAPSSPAQVYDLGYVPGLYDDASVLVRGSTKTKVFQVKADGSGIEEPAAVVDDAVGAVASDVDSAAISPDGTTVVFTWMGQVRVAPAATTGRGGSTRLGTSEGVAFFVGWLDEDHVVAEAGFGDVISIDIRTGATDTLVKLPESESPELAVALLRSRTVPGVRPPTPIDPRLYAAGGAGGALALCAVGVALWRRRGRR